MKNRRGSFYIGRSLIEDHLDVVIDLMEGMVILKAEYFMAHNAIKYTALSPLFSEVSRQDHAPDYYITCDLSGNVIAGLMGDGVKDNQLKTDNKALHDALMELCFLKWLKNTFQKEDVYIKLKKPAWDNAIKVLNVINKTNGTPTSELFARFKSKLL